MTCLMLITVCPTCWPSDQFGIMLGCLCSTDGLIAAGSPPTCTVAGKGSRCSSCISSQIVSSMQPSQLWKSAGDCAQEHDQWSVTALPCLVKVLQAMCTAAVDCSSFTTHAFFVQVVRPNNREHVKLLSVALVQDAYPLRVELAR